MSPLYPAVSRFSSTLAPNENRFSDAPTIAIDLGRSKRSMFDLGLPDIVIFGIEFLADRLPLIRLQTGLDAFLVKELREPLLASLFRIAI